MSLWSSRIDLVAFDVPFPADYGGVIDVFYKLKALYEAGWAVHLHCFVYNRQPSPELERYCRQVYYYPRKRLCNPISGKLPYITSSRAHHRLLENLRDGQGPIVFEGLHTAFFGEHPDLAHRERILRMHNIEHIYYRHLARVEDHPFRRWFFVREAKRLQQYEPVCEGFDRIAALSRSDHHRFQLKYGRSAYVPVFHPHTSVAQPVHHYGKYALYHGNLSVGENREAAIFLLEGVFARLGIPLVIAGKNPGRQLVQKVRAHSDARLVANPSAAEMERLVSEAQMHVLPTFQNTGIKLKLLNVLYNGRHVLANTPMVKHTGLEPLCYVRDSLPAWREAVAQLWEIPYGKEDVRQREKRLSEEFDNQQSLGLLLGRTAISRRVFRLQVAAH